MRYRLVCLDAGFTLLSPRATLRDALTSTLAARGHQVGDDDLHRAWEVANRWAWEAYHQPGNDTWGHDERIDQHWRDYHALMLAELGVQDAGHELLDAILAAQYAVDGWELYPDVMPALDALRAVDGLQLVIASDWGSNLHAILDRLGISGRVDFVQASASVGVGKSDPAFFRLALERAGVRAAEGLMVGDSLRADVLGARAAGMDAVLLRRDTAFTRPDFPAEEPPAGVPLIASLSELPALVAGG